MIHMKIISSLFIIGVIQTFSLYADDNSARRFAALDRDAVICKYFLLSEKQVQNSLKVTQQQVESLKSVMQSSPTNIPAFADLRRSQKQLLEASQSDEERTKIRQAGNEKATFLIHQNWEMTIQNTLSTFQIKRLDELYLQMKGPQAILEDTNIVQQLNITKQQINQLNDVISSYSQFLSLLRQRFLRVQIQPIRNRDRADLDSEIQSLVRVIKEVEKDQDTELLAVLSKKQLHLWNDLCGGPLPINWKVDYFSDTPFQ